MFDIDTLLGLAAALGAGLLIGVERERRKGQGPNRALAGIRTFGLVALAGAGTQATQQPVLVYAGAVLVVLLAVISYWRDRSRDPGVTTEVALFVTYILGVIAMDWPALAAGSAVVITALLVSRGSLHRFSVNLLSGAELRDALLFCGAALVVLPLLPERVAWWPGDFNPRRLWTLVVLFMGLQGAGYIALRAAGPKLGLAVSGFVSGFVSSTTTIAALGLRARQHPALLQACVSGALFSSVATVLLLAIVAAAIDPAALRMLVPSLLGATLVALATALLFLRRQPRASHEALSKGSAFNLSFAALFALILSVVTALMTYTTKHYGHLAVQLGAGLAGFFDAHAAAASALALGASGTVPRSELVLAVAVAFSTNTCSKLVAALGAGGAAYGLRVGVGLLAIAAMLWAPLIWLRIVAL